MPSNSVQGSRATGIVPGLRLRRAVASSAWKVVTWPLRVLHQWRDEEELRRYLASATPAERAELQAMGVELPPRRPDANLLLHAPWR